MFWGALKSSNLKRIGRYGKSILVKLNQLFAKICSRCLTVVGEGLAVEDKKIRKDLQVRNTLDTTGLDI